MFPVTHMHTTGAEQLAKNLEQFGDHKARSIVAGGVRSGVVVLARAQRSAAPRGQTDVKGAIGYRVMRKGRTMLSGKAGGGVGVAGKGPKITARKKGKRGGVGISGRNIHWYIFGTAPRYTGVRSWRVKGGMRRKKTGNARAFRGRMPPHGFIRQAATASIGPASFAMRAQIAKGIGREWARRQKKMGSRY